MKKNLIYIVLLFCILSCSLFNKNSTKKVVKTEDSKVLSNKIDSLETTSDVIEFARTINPKFNREGLGKMKIKTTDSIAKDLDCSDIFKDWNVLNWEKVDLNNDGKTDLIFHAYSYSNYSPYTIVDMGNAIYKLYNFSTGNNDDCEFIKPIKIGNYNELKFYHAKSIANNELGSIPRVIRIDTLTYKFDSFVEINTSKKASYNIVSIEINTSNCFGECPSYQLQINREGIAAFSGKSYTKFKGKSTKKIALSYFTEIVKILEYIKVKELDDAYDVDWTDSQTSVLTIKFSDGSIKEIRDYGMEGTFGLSLVYNNLFKIASETNWE